MCGISCKAEAQGSVNDELDGRFKYISHIIDWMGTMHRRGGSSPGSRQELILGGVYLLGFESLHHHE